MVERGRRVIVGVDGSVGSLQAVRRVVTEARLRDATLVSVLAWVPPGGEGVSRRAPAPPSLQRLWQQDARARLCAAWEQALGGTPADLVVGLVVVRGPAGEVLVRFADREDDLLVVGTGRQGAFRRMFGAGAVARHCVARAGCGVLTVPPSSLGRQFQRAALRQAVTQRRLIRDIIEHGAR